LLPALRRWSHSSLLVPWLVVAHLLEGLVEVVVVMVPPLLQFKSMTTSSSNTFAPLWRSLASLTPL